jgi:hypothetical protein
MNDNYSNAEWIYKTRWLAAQLRQAVNAHPIVVLTGARQVGKSTLLRNEAPFRDWKYISFDDLEAVALAKRHPAALWTNCTNLIVDEVQKCADILPAIKLAVDQNPQMRFILSGSSNLLLMRNISESLAGRAVYLTLKPMTIGELTDLAPANPLQKLFEGRLSGTGIDTTQTIDLFKVLLSGLMPIVSFLPDRQAILRWWESYILTYLERDLRQLSQIESLPDFRRLMTALALRNGQMLNQTEIARDIAISQPSVYRYINLLEMTGLLEKIPAFTFNRTSRLIKTPKIYWIDPGLVSFLAGIFDENTMRNSREIGAIFETLILLHLKVQCNQVNPPAKLYYWRTVTGKEVDFIVEWGRTLLAVEVKLTDNPRLADAKNLELFINDYPETALGLLLHTGKEVKSFGTKIAAVPWQIFTI